MLEKMVTYNLLVILMAAYVTSVPMRDDIPLPFDYYSKEDWGGRPSTGTTELHRPVPYVVIHHSYDPPACYNATACKEAMRYIQDLHQITNGWNDIGYNFAVGSDGAVYEGRGWAAVGAHAVAYNSKSIGIVFIGDWVSSLPPPNQLQTAKDLIKVGIKLGHIACDYDLIGHRQVATTECPGETLYKEISSWDRFQPHPDKKSNLTYTYYTRKDWGANPATGKIQPLATPVQYVVIHHTYIPGACNTTDDCSAKMRSMQRYHQSLDWGDIGYNFAVGGEAGVYEGRGWEVVGIHAGWVNRYSIGIVLIGDWRVNLPPAQQLEATKALIATGLQRGFISQEYRLIGHNQATATECPGKALMDHIATWDHYWPQEHVKPKTNKDVHVD